MKSRKSLSAKERLRLFALHGGICHICGGIINGIREAYDIEHVIPLSMGGMDDDVNRKPAHRKCHGPKTKRDAGNLGEAKRREARHIGAKAAPVRTIQGRPKAEKPPPKQLPPRRSMYEDMR